MKHSTEDDTLQRDIWQALDDLRMPSLRWALMQELNVQNFTVGKQSMTLGLRDHFRRIQRSNLKQGLATWIRLGEGGLLFVPDDLDKTALKLAVQKAKDQLQRETTLAKLGGPAPKDEWVVNAKVKGYDD